MSREVWGGWTLEATASPTPDDRWTVEVLIVQGAVRRHLPGLGTTFPTRRDAEEAGIDLGKSWIRKRGEAALSQSAQDDEDLNVGLRIVEAYLGARGYMVLVELRTGDPTVTFRLEQEGRRCSLLARRDTLMREDLEDLLASPEPADRLAAGAMVLLEEVIR